MCVAWIFYNKRYLCISYGVKEQKKKLEVKPKERKKNVLIKKGGLSTLETFKKENPRDNNWLIIRTL